MIKKIALGLLLLLFFKANAQNSTLYGVVTDSLQTPLVYANVIAKPQNSVINMSFSITDEQGRYKLELIKDEVYTISVSFLGYQPQNFELKISENTSKNMVLKQASELLNEVVIIQQLPVEVKEDTITYRTKAFVTGEERKLKAVLNKLPGVEVDKSGLVTVQGKRVTHMLVEGKKFFGGGSKLAVENIPANAVGEVEVIDNYNEITMLKGLEETDDMAMNIKLKKDKKQFTFGDVEAGKGNEDFYVAHAGLFYYSPKTRLNFIGDINNIGENAFTYSDYKRFEESGSSSSKSNGSIYNTSSTNLGLLLDTEDAVEITNKFTALNLTTPLSLTTEVSGYALFSNNKAATLNKNVTQYLFEDAGYTERLTKAKEHSSSLAIAKLSVAHKPSLTSEWYFNTNLKYNSRNAESINKSVIDVTETNFNLNTALNELQLKQDVEWYKKMNRKHTTSFIFKYNYNNNAPESYWFSNNLASNQTAINYTIFQQIKSKSNQLDTSFKHYWLLGSKSQLQTTIGYYFFNDSYVTNVNENLVENATNSFEDINFDNNLNYTLNDLFLGVNYKFKRKKLLVEAGGYLHNYNWKIIQDENVTNNRISFLPEITAKYSFRKSEKLQFWYALKNKFTDTQQLTNNYTLLNYNILFKGNPNLEYTSYHSARLLYTLFNLYKNIILSGNIGFNKQNEVINNEITVVDINQLLSPVLLEYPTLNTNVSADLYKRYGKFKIQLAARYDVSDYTQLINNKLSEGTNFHQYYKTSVATNFDKLPNIKIGYNFRFSNYKSETTVSNYTTKEPYFEFNYQFLNGFVFQTEYFKNTFENKALTKKDTYQLANASLFYQKEDSAWGFEISAKNMFNVKYKLTNNINDYLISDTKKYIMPRVFMFTVTYKL